MNSKCNVIELNLNPVLAKKIIKDILANSGRVFFVDHAEKRMKQRRITRTQVFSCLRHGDFSEEPARSVKGNWKFTMESFSAGERVSVAAALDNDTEGNYILIITVFN